MSERDSKLLARRKRIKSLIVAGYSVNDIKLMCSFSPNQIDDFFNSLSNDIEYEYKMRTKKISFGSKTEPYYPPELYTENEFFNLHMGDNKTGLALKYNFDDLSPEEKEFYHQSNKIMKHETEKFKINYAGLSHDHRTNLWNFDCKSCNKAFSPPTTMLSKQLVECPKCASEECINYNLLGGKDKATEHK